LSSSSIVVVVGKISKKLVQLVVLILKIYPVGNQGGQDCCCSLDSISSATAKNNKKFILDQPSAESHLN
jgi:hypothetical protein